jgi:hypothetical protein
MVLPSLYQVAGELIMIIYESRSNDYSYDDGGVENQLTKIQLSMIVEMSVGVPLLILAFLYLRRHLRLKMLRFAQSSSKALILPTSGTPPAPLLNPTDVDILALSELPSPEETGSATGQSMVQTQGTLPSYRPLDGAKAPTYCTNETTPTAVHK